MLEKFHNLVHFNRAPGIILRAMVSENVNYGGLRVVPRISLRKLHNLLLRLTLHFVKFSDSGTF